VAAACLTFASAANAQASRTWVSGVGDDVNPCSRTAPCKTFAGAISKTAAGGEINAIDPGAFGTVTVTKSITIDARHLTSGVLNTGTNGVNVNAGVNDTVVLRGLDITAGTGAFCTYGGQTGVRVLSAKSVRIEDSTISRQNKAVDITPSAAAVDVVVNRVEISNNCASGVSVVPTATGKATLTIKDSSITNSGTAVSVADAGSAWLTGNLLSTNALGVQAVGTGEISDFGDNRYVANTADGTPTKTITPPTATGPAGEAGATGATGTTGAAGPEGQSALKLLLTPASRKLTARAGRTVVVTYRSSAATRGTVTVARAGKTVKRAKATAKAGKNAVRVSTKGLAAGKYTVTLSAKGADGQTAKTTATLQVRDELR